MADRSIMRLGREWAPIVIVAVLVALFVRVLLFQAYEIPTESMRPTLEVGDRVVVNRVSYRFGDIERGQVVVFDRPAGVEGDDDLIKRIVGLPGETIHFVDRQVYIDGLRVVEPYLLSPDSTRPTGSISTCAQSVPAVDRCTIPDDHVFVMGDNRGGSSDSRDFGPIPTDTIIGRAFWRVWPLNDLSQL